MRFSFLDFCCQKSGSFWESLVGFFIKRPSLFFPKLQFCFANQLLRRQIATWILGRKAVNNHLKFFWLVLLQIFPFQLKYRSFFSHSWRLIPQCVTSVVLPSGTNSDSQCPKFLLSIRKNCFLWIRLFFENKPNLKSKTEKCFEWRPRSEAFLFKNMSSSTKKLIEAQKKTP